MTGCPTPSPKPLRDTEVAEREFATLVESWQARHKLEYYDVIDILRRHLHYLYLKKLNSKVS
jgi:hypothetical protein